MKTYEALRNIIAAMGVTEELDEQLKATALRILDEIEKRTESAAAKKKAEPKKKKKAFDIDRVHTLLDAGWSIPKIAEELGCADQTVRNHLKAEEEKK